MAGSTINKQISSILLKEQSYWYGSAIQKKQIENNSRDKWPNTYGSTLHNLYALYSKHYKNIYYITKQKTDFLRKQF